MKFQSIASSVFDGLGLIQNNFYSAYKFKASPYE